MSELENLLQHTWPVSRVNERRAFDTPVQLRSSGASVEGWCNDLGLGGIGFTAPAEFHPGDQVQLEFCLRNSAPVQTSIMIRWSDGFRHGGEFLKPTAELLNDIRLVVSAPVKNSSKLKVAGER
jgi:PilZ domain